MEYRYSQTPCADLTLSFFSLQPLKERYQFTQQPTAVASLRCHYPNYRVMCLVLSPSTICLIGSAKVAFSFESARPTPYFFSLFFSPAPAHPARSAPCFFKETDAKIQALFHLLQIKTRIYFLEEVELVEAAKTGKSISCCLCYNRSGKNPSATPPSASLSSPPAPAERDAKVTLFCLPASAPSELFSLLPLISCKSVRLFFFALLPSA